MTFDEVLDQVRELLHSKGRVTYRALKRRFELDDDYLDDLKAELIKAEGVAADEDGEVLVWTGAAPVQSSTFQVPSPSQSLTPNPQSLAERRQLTVMFCDLVGSTALSAQLDPEELREVVRGYQETCTTVIRRYDGHIAQHLGDGLLVYFGYPVAHEDDAARAVRAGLEIIQALQSRARQQAANAPLPHGRGSDPFHVRIGIHTGLVVIGEIGSSEKREMLALGETPNIAARIQGHANPDEVIISAATHRLVEGLFTCEDRGQPELKGVTTPLNLYRVLKESDAHSRFEVVVRKGLTPLIGREHEHGLLRERWARVKDGAGQVVLLSGEPGIGKSRLVEALKEAVEREGERCLELRCSPYTQNSALAPVIEHLQRTLQFRPEDSAEEKLQRLVQALGRLVQSDEPVIASAAKQSLQGTEIASSSATPRNDTTRLPEVVSLFATLLSLPHPDGYPALTFSPQKQKEKTYEALVAWLCAEATTQAMTYAWEDLHWADPSTLELLTLFLQQVPTTRLLTVVTFRPEFVPPWGAHSYLSQLTLSRLGRTHVEMMVEQVAGSKALSTEIIQQIVSKTDGVPLFVEELTKMVVEAETDGGAQRAVPLPLGIPSTLQDALMARLDRLGTAKEIAQLGATLGREFNYDLLHAISPLNEDALHQGLKQLVDSELVYQSGLPPQARYLFKHALVQDTAYQSLLKSRRQQLHQTIGQVLEEQFPQTVETQPELVAHHYTEAGLAEQAILYWQRAGQSAVERSAHVEALSHLTWGLKLLKTLPDTPERIQQELVLQIARGASLMATRGYAAPEVEHAYSRARELCQSIDDTLRIFPVLIGLWRFYATRAELRTAHELAEQLLSLARQTLHHPARLLGASQALGMTLVNMGEFTSAREHLEQGIVLYDPQQHRRHALRSGQDAGVVCLGHMAWDLWALGHPDQARHRLHEMLSLAEELCHPLSLAWAKCLASIVYQFRRERQKIQEQVEVVIRLSHEHGFAQLLAQGIVWTGWLLVEKGQEEEGIRQMRQGLDAHRDTGAEIYRPYFLLLLAEAYGKVGQIKEGLTALAEALERVNKSGERWWEAELHRLKGELLLMQARDRATGNRQQSESSSQ